MNGAFTLNGKPRRAGTARRLTRLADDAARRARPDRHQGRLRRRRLRRLHGAARRPAGVRACLVPMRRRSAGRAVTTVEGLASRRSRSPRCRRRSSAHGAAQCGICTPGMLMAAARAASRRNARADARRGGGRAGRRALPLHRLPQDRRRRAGCDAPAARRGACRPARRSAPASRASTACQGRRHATRSAPTCLPGDALWVRVVRSPHARARFDPGRSCAVARQPASPPC